MLAVTLGKLRGHVDAKRETAYLAQLRHLPAALNSWRWSRSHRLGRGVCAQENALFLGRGLHYPISLGRAELRRFRIFTQA